MLLLLLLLFSSDAATVTPPFFHRKKQGPSAGRRGGEWHGLPFHGRQNRVERGLKDLINVGCQGEELLEAREKGEFQSRKVRGAGMIGTEECQGTELELIHPPTYPFTL